MPIIFEGLKEIENSSIDLIFVDSPYNIGKDFDGLVENWEEQDFLKWKNMKIILLKNQKYY